MQDNHGSNPKVSMLSNNQPEQPDFFDQGGDEVRKIATAVKLKKFWRYSIHDFTL